jgi:hypothetical protein
MRKVTAKTVATAQNRLEVAREYGRAFDRVTRVRVRP